MDIFKAIRSGNVGAVKAYIEQGGDLKIRNASQMTPLIAAADECRSHIVNIILQAKVDVNATDKYGQTALHLAAGRNDFATVKLLIAARADLNARAAVNSLTALQFAESNKQKEAAELLRKAGAK